MHKCEASTSHPRLFLQLRVVLYSMQHVCVVGKHPGSKLLAFCLGIRISNSSPLHHHFCFTSSNHATSSLLLPPTSVRRFDRRLRVVDIQRGPLYTGLSTSLHLTNYHVSQYYTFCSFCKQHTPSPIDIAKAWRICPFIREHLAIVGIRACPGGCNGVTGRVKTERMSQPAVLLRRCTAEEQNPRAATPPLSTHRLTPPLGLGGTSFRRRSVNVWVLGDYARYVLWKRSRRACRLYAVSSTGRLPSWTPSVRSR